MQILEYAVNLLQGGLNSLASYLAAHVLLCLLPAFFVAGAMTVFIPKEAITRYLGRTAHKYVSYPAAALAGSVLAVCSCTIVPLFAGIYKKGAGLGPAITFLFFAPAANILALSYTGVAIGMDLAIARLVLSLTFGIGIGMIMALIFSRQDAAHDEQTNDAFGRTAKVPKRNWLFVALLVALLLAGTLKIGLLLNSYAQVTVPIAGVDRLQATLDRLIPYDVSRGEEGLSVQGLLLIGLLALIALSAWKGLSHVDEGYNRWTWAALILIVVTLLVAGVSMTATPDGLEIRVLGKSVAVALLMLAVYLLARLAFDEYEVQEWLWESWKFVRQIFPLLIVGVFCVGVVRELIKPEWIEAVAGSNTLLGNMAGVFFGVFMYFPTLVEVPIAKMFLSLGMHRGPLLAYLMSDPELSLQSILITATIIGRFRAWVYVGWVALFSTLAGLLYGGWVDGTSAWLIGLYLVGFVALLAVGLVWVGRRNRRTVPQAEVQA